MKAAIRSGRHTGAMEVLCTSEGKLRDLVAHVASHVDRLQVDVLDFDLGRSTERLPVGEPHAAAARPHHSMAYTCLSYSGGGVCTG